MVQPQVRTFSKRSKKSLTQYNLEWERQKCVATDDGKNMYCAGKGLVGQIYKAVESADCFKPVVLHCIIQQQPLCGKYLNLSCFMEHVVSTVNFICSHGLIHRQFREFLTLIEATYSDLLYHTSVQWLNCGKAMSQFFELRNMIEIFLNEETRPQPLLTNNEWNGFGN
ncbi:general transcription factor II-I repeat domain-containing protein 2-like [Tachypleus tridentatus]|uniref:general transcription factor II-I repeat domain-containing protein 2-like n=1 Tax=Tachypleus tridentatus TaxID=6853 RepID=UPI003FD5EB0B